MNESVPPIRTVVVEREFAHPPEKLWRALTQPHLLEAWLMKTDFALAAGHRFQFRGEWGAVDCVVSEIEPLKTLSYSWSAMGLESEVTWTLEATARGTLLRMEQVGFRPDQEHAYQGAKFGWNRNFGALEEVLAKEAA